MSTLEIVLVILLPVVLVVGGFAGYFLRVKQKEQSLTASRLAEANILEEAKKQAEELKKKALAEAREEINQIKRENEESLRERKKVVVELENKLTQREESLDRRSLNLDKREDTLAIRETKLDDRKAEIEQLHQQAEELVAQQQTKLTEIAALTEAEARQIIMDRIKEEMATEIAQYIRDEEEKAKDEAQVKAKNILSLAIQKYASETSSEKTVSVVSIPSDEMKGRIIGREGRNIRTIESLTGVDLIIDDTPDAVVLSGFDPIRREIARKSLETLISDGRIHPARIEEIVERCRQEVEMYIREKGEEAVFKAQIGKVHPDLVKILGRLHYRTSYGQNVLQHSLETAFLAGKLAAELGENETIARRAGLFHDIGKAIDHEVEGSHVDIGVALATKYREPKEVIDAIASHHGDVEPQSIIAVLVAASDAVSSARPGARADSLENYVKRLKDLEDISNSVSGVDSSFAIQAGREIRVMVKPEQVDDQRLPLVAHQIKEEIEKKLSYPGTITVTVVREKRAVEIAK